VIQTIQMGVPVARMEFVDAASIRAVNRYSNFTMAERPTLFMEFHGTEAGVAEQAETVGELAAAHDGSAFEWTTKPEERNRLWAARHNFYYALKAMVPGKRGFATDACVPISRLAECIDETERDLAGAAIFFAIVGHVGDGNFHVSLMIDPEDRAEIDEAMRLADRLTERTLAMGGTVSGEHGVGIGKRKFMAREHGADAWELMAAIKRTFDPAGILNPGKMLPGN
jgi:D-lactate dehydrogenase (cytochrome)